MNPFGSGDGNSLAGRNVNGPTPEQAKKAYEDRCSQNAALHTHDGCLHKQGGGGQCWDYCGDRRCLKVKA